MGTGMGAGDLNKGRLSGGPASGIRRDGVLPQRRGLEQHTAGIKCRGKLLAHRRLLAGKQYDDLPPIVRHGRQQLEQAVRNRRDTAHAYGAGARRQVIGQGIGHNVSRLAGLDHISTVQTTRVGTQKLEHTSLGIAFWLRLAIVATASLGRRPRTRGVVMNPVDHPMGGGEGRASGGHPRSRKGLLAKGYKTRNPKKTTSKFIISKKKK